MDEKLISRKMSFNKFVLSLFFLFFILNSYAFDCKTEGLMMSRYVNYSQSEVIALCKVNSNGFLDIIEYFKGELNKESSFSFKTKLNLNKDEIWLIYAKYNKDNELLIDECSISRNIQKPFLVNVAEYNPPSPVLYKENQLLFENKMDSIKQLSFIDLNNELLWLYSRKQNKNIKLLLKKKNDKIKYTNDKLIYLFLSIIIPQLALVCLHKSHCYR